MITVIVNAKVKCDFLNEYLEVASLLTKESRNRAGCVSYVFNQSVGNPLEFTLFEQWESQAHLDEHIKALIDLLGAPDPGGMLPAKLINFYESAEPKFYNSIE
ncbi:antibiotic biosynthesis monooxygenase [Motilimonas cestriensis]|uniref:Antibiotic biosynthesis monooxygenase n=1 Tax=Motilimonas cestriensis TaxID=2742685 RepID=A0ABS8W9W8_9GAMM|nr:putative quinol monooxygenase [Motilimonas cestriensis]MCE2595318.1 antibiotic biosynthesis monooxygenase [Motilimonas cestriensis]